MNKLSILIVEDKALVAEDLAGKIQQWDDEVAGITVGATGTKAGHGDEQHFNNIY